eukprot:3824949-Alexandrium_andersonii.AAC.1
MACCRMCSTCVRCLTRALKALAWTDTRDMVADGATRGAVDRELLHLAMSGTSGVQHATKVWHAKGN